MDEDKKEIITREKLFDYMESIYEVTTVVPLASNPYEIIRIMDQNDLNELLEDYNSYGEFLISIKKIN